ncbi:MAG TPA: phosphate/phosphite/phosphonate ABC transporter substrate-binding protein [Geobacteraceae bacterium]|nr:phosphate/phosphite/phosphonate ABC transporter substrate-binding protein [Geobacteraceae bacterium]
MGKLAKISVVLLALATCLLPITGNAAPGGKLVIAVIPEMNLVKQMERFTPLGRYLEMKTGMAVEIKPLSNYGQLYEEMRDGNIDAGFFGSFVYAMTRARLGIVPLVRPVQPGGKSTYTGMIFVRKDSGIRKPADMKGKTIALVDPSTTAGYIAPKEYLLNHGINIDTDMKIYWSASHEAAIRAVLHHQADVGVSKDTVIRKYRRDNRVFDTIVDIIAETPKKGVPDNTLAVRKGLDIATREKLKNVLLTMHKDPQATGVLAKFGASKFIVTSDDDFKPLYELTRHMKIDLRSYPYRKPSSYPTE